MSASDLEHEIVHRPDFSLLRVRLRAGQKVFAEPSAMASMDPVIRMKAGFKGGLFKSIGRAFGGESMIINTFTAEQDGEVCFAPGPMGDLHHYRLGGGANLLIQRGSYIANGEGVEVSGKWQGLRGFFSGEGLVLLRATGDGDLFFNTYGALVEIDVQDGWFVDTGYVVAFEDTLDYRVTVLPGLGIGKKLKSFIFGGEGLVCAFTGQGKVWVQTRATNPWLSWTWPFRPVQRNNGE